jgi:hypothetical protein
VHPHRASHLTASFIASNPTDPVVISMSKKSNLIAHLTLSAALGAICATASAAADAPSVPPMIAYQVEVAASAQRLVDPLILGLLADVSLSGGSVVTIVGKEGGMRSVRTRGYVDSCSERAVTTSSVTTGTTLRVGPTGWKATRFTPTLCWTPVGWWQ